MDRPPSQTQPWGSSCKLDHSVVRVVRLRHRLAWLPSLTTRLTFLLRPHLALESMHASENPSQCMHHAARLAWPLSSWWCGPSPSFSSQPVDHRPLATVADGMPHDAGIISPHQHSPTPPHSPIQPTPSPGHDRMCVAFGRKALAAAGFCAIRASRQRCLTDAAAE